jgi:hypothetical protein
MLLRVARTSPLNRCFDTLSLVFAFAFESLGSRGHSRSAESALPQMFIPLVPRIGFTVACDCFTLSPLHARRFNFQTFYTVIVSHGGYKFSIRSHLRHHLTGKEPYVLILRSSHRHTHTLLVVLFTLLYIFSCPPPPSSPSTLAHVTRLTHIRHTLHLP